MRVGTVLAEGLGIVLSDQVTFDRIKAGVGRIEETVGEATGRAKRAALQDYLQTIGLELLGIVGNILLELAVYVVKAELGKELGQVKAV